MTVAAKVAFQILEIDEKAYHQSQTEHRKNPQVAAKLKKCEERARLEVESKNEVLASKDELKKIYLEKLKLEGQVEMKLAHVQARSP